MTFEQLIYNNQYKIKNISVLLAPQCWPSYVDVLDCTYTIDSAYCLYETNEPNSVYGWVDYQFRGQYNANVTMVTQAIRLWWAVYERMIQHLIEVDDYPAKNWKHCQYLMFNATWSLFGYIEGQDPKANLVAAICMGSADFHKATKQRLPPSMLPKQKADISSGTKAKPQLTPTPSPPSRPAPKAFSYKDIISRQ